ncbi:MAG: hypothetical protein ACI86M_003004 [Saprospiraceae bacterium]|jgi:hypothetical protein
MEKLKICFVLFFLTCSIQAAFSQLKARIEIPEYYTRVLDYSAEAKPYFLKVSKSKVSTREYDKSQISYVEYLDIDNQLWTQKQVGIPNVLNLDIYFKGERYPLILKRRFLRSDDYKLTASSPSESHRYDSYFYNGVIEGDYNSWATLAVINGKYKLLLASEDGNIEVSHENDNTYNIYESEDLVEVPAYECQTNDSPQAHSKTSAETVRSVGSDCVELYIECDNQSYIDNGGSIANTEAWALSIINDVATIYNLINIPLVVNSIFIWNNVDPYATGTTMQAVRDSFVNQIENTYDGRIAQLFSTRALGGGLAYGIGGFCGSYPEFPGPYSIATSLETSYSGYPNFSFTVNVVAHELGHVFGARHTHACVWGSEYDSQIDDCGNIYAAANGDQPEGQGCFDENNPILPNNGGTIMSFCNLAGGGIDLANGFGTEVGDFIFEKYNTAVCATGGACASILPSNDDCANAIELSLKGECSYFDYDNIMSTSSGVADPSCGTPGVAQDVWFSITPSNEDALLNFNPVQGQVVDVIITVYSGTCGNLTEINCEEAFDEEIQVKLTGLTPNETIYIRIIEESSDMEGIFQLCAIDEYLPCHPAINQLVDLYNNTNGASWTSNVGWIAGAAGTNCTPCTWYGITCDNQENIIEVDLFNNNLVGTVPSTLGELTKIRTLKLMNNDLSGTFPDIWADLDVIEFIDLSNNEFTGIMPSSLGSLLKLNTLYIENNNMDGELLASIADLPLLNVYWVKNNNFSGCYPDSYTELCDIGSTKFTNNPLLPSSGNNFEEFCSQGLGGDIDDDGYCFGTNVGEDCVDNDDTIYPTAPELCDGKDNDCDGDYDEELTSDNTWITSGSGNWTNPSNWSLGIIPAACHDIILPVSGPIRIITISDPTEAFARSVTIFSNNTLDNEGILSISGSDDNGLILNSGGAYQNLGTTEIKNISLYGIRTNGSIGNEGNIFVENLGTDFEVYILDGAIFLNNGIILIR